MCLCVQPYRHNTRLCIDDPRPERNDKNSSPGLNDCDILIDNHGMTYIAVRNCDLDRFSVK